MRAAARNPRSQGTARENDALEPDQAKGIAYWLASGFGSERTRNTTPDGEPRLHYPCAGYKKFCRHVRKYLRAMDDDVAAERSAGDAGHAAVDAPLIVTTASAEAATGDVRPRPTAARPGTDR